MAAVICNDKNWLMGPGNDGKKFFSTLTRRPRPPKPQTKSPPMAIPLAQSRKLLKTVATRCHILRRKCTKFDFLILTLTPLGSLQRSPRPSSWNSGDLLLNFIARAHYASTSVYSRQFSVVWFPQLLAPLYSGLSGAYDQTFLWLPEQQCAWSADGDDFWSHFGVVPSMSDKWTANISIVCRRRTPATVRTLHSCHYLASHNCIQQNRL